MITWRRLTTAPGAEEPVALDELLSWARVTDNAEIPTLERLIRAARTEVERWSGHALLPGTFTITSDAWLSRFELPLTPIDSVDEVRSLGFDGTPATVDASAYSVTLALGVPGVVGFLAPWGYWPASVGVEIDVTAGYASRDDVPADIRQAVLTVALLHYQHRDDPRLLEEIQNYLGTVASGFGLVQI